MEADGGISLEHQFAFSRLKVLLHNNFLISAVYTVHSSFLTILKKQVTKKKTS